MANYLALVAVEIKAPTLDHAKAQASEFGMLLDIERDTEKDQPSDIGRLEAEAVLTR